MAFIRGVDGLIFTEDTYGEGDENAVSAPSIYVADLVGKKKTKKGCPLDGSHNKKMVRKGK